MNSIFQLAFKVTDIESTINSITISQIVNQEDRLQTLCFISDSIYYKIGDNTIVEIMAIIKKQDL